MIKKPESDLDFLNKIRGNFTLFNVNSARIDGGLVLANLAFFEAPDYVYNEHYVERFVVDAYERISVKPDKLTSIRRSDECALEKRASQKQDMFNTVQYKTPDRRTNTKYLKKNIFDLIKQKTGKISSYDQKYPHARFRHLLIELDCKCEVFIDRNGSFYNQKVDSIPLARIEYEVYRDRSFIEGIRKEFSVYWDLLFFIKSCVLLDEQHYNVYCLDLKQEIFNLNMINYPDEIFQLMLGPLVSTKSFNVNTENYVYKCHDNEKRRLLYSLNPSEIEIDGVCFKKNSSHDSIFSNKNHSINFELSQLAFSFNKNLDEIALTECKNILRETIRLIFLGNEIELTYNGLAEKNTIGIFI